MKPKQPKDERDALPHPIQPLADDGNGVTRFKQNAIVQHLLEFGQARNFGLNEIARCQFSKEDRIQFAQLIGYSLSGFGELSYVDDLTYATASRMAESGVGVTEARVATLAKAFVELQDALRAPIAALYGIHPDDLRGSVDGSVPTEGD